MDSAQERDSTILYHMRPVVWLSGWTPLQGLAGMLDLEPTGGLTLALINHSEGLSHHILQA